ncbi:unnamed protein product [Moneuplotes crassus]|uniref:Uncharacterized protein n=1 Tax=Euplotes crassus TaxID=5936 RepID=A0AAD1XSB0_EUPCR|nr:unnamed protein product [Moneuplotes crassus]
MQIDLTAQDLEYSYNPKLQTLGQVDNDDIEDFIGDSERFHRKLLENGIIDPDYAEFLTELDESAKYEKESIQKADQYYAKEIERIKNFYEDQLQQIREESEQAINSLQGENQTLDEKCRFLTEQVNELQAAQVKKTPNLPTTSRNAFLRRNSENHQLKGKQKTTLKNSRSPLNTSTSQSREQEDAQIHLEAVNSKLKKKVDELTGRAKRLKVSWESKIEDQKKEIKSLQTDSKDLRTKLSQQKSKSQREINKHRDINIKLEKEIETLKKSLKDLEKEKIQLKGRLDRNFAERSVDIQRKKRMDLSRSTARSYNDFDFFSKKMNTKQNQKDNLCFNRKNSHISKRENKLFSSTASLQHFNLFKTTKNLNSKNNGNCREGSKSKGLRSPKESNTSTKHKTCSRRGICSVGLDKKGCGHYHHSKRSTSRNSLNRTSLQYNSTTSAMKKIKDMCQVMVDSCSRLECARCFNMYPPTDFLEHINNEEECTVNDFNPEILSNEKDLAIDSNSPQCNKKKKIKNKENNLDEINPLSERGSMGSLKKSLRSSIKGIKLPPHDKALKERSVAHISNLSYHDNSYDEEFYNQKNKQTLNNLHMRDAVSSTNLLGSQNNCNIVHQSMDIHSNLFRNSIMTPVNYHGNESFVIQPHCKCNLLQSQCNLSHHPSCCHHQKQNLTMIESQAYGPSIEDRLENTEKLIREMNHKFDGLTSPKQSAKNEFNMLVQTLTMNSALQDYNADSDTDNQEDSGQSSFDEETLSMNQRDLRKYFKKNMKQQKMIEAQDHDGYPEELRTGRRVNQKYIDKHQFSNSRYENVEEDELDQYYTQQQNKYSSSENKVDNEEYSHEDDIDESSSDHIYKKAKNSIKRSKMIISTEQEDQLLNEMSYSDPENQLEMLKLSSKRVESILRNKQKRKNKPVCKEETLDNLRQNRMADDSDSCKIQMSSEFDHEYSHGKKMLERKNSRNRLYEATSPNEVSDKRNFHQTTSSGNLVLYDSVARMSSQSPQEYIDPNYVQRHIPNYKNRDESHDFDEDDINSSDNIADEDMAYDDQEYEQEVETETQRRYRKGLNKYVNQMSLSKFKN